MKFVIEILVVLIFAIILFFLVRGLVTDIITRKQIKLEEKKKDNNIDSNENK